MLGHVRGRSVLQYDVLYCSLTLRFISASCELFQCLQNEEGEGEEDAGERSAGRCVVLAKARSCPGAFAVYDAPR